MPDKRRVRRYVPVGEVVVVDIRVLKREGVKSLAARKAIDEAYVRRIRFEFDLSPYFYILLHVHLETEMHIVSGERHEN